MLNILLRNNQFLALNKPAGLPVQSDKTGDDSLQKLAETYCKHPLHLVNRVDRPASGIVVFAKSPAAMTALTAQFSERTVEKIYLAVVKNQPPEMQGRLKHFIKKDGVKNVSSVYSESRPGSEEADLEYEVVASSDAYFLLKIKLLTGRHHQIRAQLAAIGCPVKGDVKYGARRSNLDRSIHLHAWKLNFIHPVSDEKIEIEAPLPDENLWKFFAEKLENNEKTESPV